MQPSPVISWPRPTQVTPLNGSSRSGNGTSEMSQNALSMTVSSPPPETVIPVPIGPALACPPGAKGVCALCSNTQQDRVWVMGLFLP